MASCKKVRCVWALAPVEITDMVGSLQEPHSRNWRSSVFHNLTHEQSRRVVELPFGRFGMIIGK